MEVKAVEFIKSGAEIYKKQCDDDKQNGARAAGMRLRRCSSAADLSCNG
jgi:hypothetical protein